MCVYFLASLISKSPGTHSFHVSLQNGKDPNKIILNHHFYRWTLSLTRPNREKVEEAALAESYVHLKHQQCS